MPNPDTMTPRQQAWFATLKDNLVTETGRTIEQWTAIAQTCPETKHRARLTWMKVNHGLGQNRASVILGLAFPAETSWNDPDALADTLWADPPLRAIFEAIKSDILTLPDVMIGQRKGYTAFSRSFQFAAARPVKGIVLLELAMPPSESLRLVAPARAVWSERLKSEAALSSPADIAPLTDAIRTAWAAS